MPTESGMKMPLKLQGLVRKFLAVCPCWDANCSSCRKVRREMLAELRRWSDRIHKR